MAAQSSFTGLLFGSPAGMCLASAFSSVALRLPGFPEVAFVDVLKFQSKGAKLRIDFFPLWL
jgi:hypothetical protein